MLWEDIELQAIKLDEAAESCTIDGESPVIENFIWYYILAKVPSRTNGGSPCDTLYAEGDWASA